MKKTNTILFVSIFAACLLAGCAKTDTPPAETTSPAAPTEETTAISHFEAADVTQTVSDPMDFSQMVQSLADHSGLSYGEVLRALPESVQETEGSTYRVLSLALPITATYQPCLDIYLETQEQAKGWTSLSPQVLHLRNSQEAKAFHGQIGVWLRENSRLEVLINGDFYAEEATSFTFQGAEHFAGISYILVNAFPSESSIYCYNHFTVSLNG